MPRNSDLQGIGCSAKRTLREGGDRDVTHKRGRDSLCIRGTKSPTNRVVTVFASEVSSLLGWPNLVGMS